MDIEKLKTSRRKLEQLEQLSPFELKDSLINLASEHQKECSISMLNAGRGNPNWTATIPREAFFTLGQFALEECKRTFEHESGLAGVPQKAGIAHRFETFLKNNHQMPGIALLKKLYSYGIEKHSFVPDDFVIELADSIIGDQYPSPDRMLKHTEVIVHDYLIQEMCAGKATKSGKYDIFAVEGGTAAMCYIFNSLLENGLLNVGDKVAIGVPAFTPYLEIPELEKFNFDVTYIKGSAKDEAGNSNFQYTEEELDKLGDKSIKAFFVINPSNPTSVQIDEKSRKYLVKVVKNLNPNLMIVTDDVYGTFVDGFESLMDFLPNNTLCVYSYSKYFGCTGWRLGVIALYEDNIYDKMLSAFPDKVKEAQKRKYENLTLRPDKLRFIDRLVADSRLVALNHTAGLSLPQQMQMLLFSAFALLDEQNNYKKDCCSIVRNRYNLLWQGMNMPIYPDPNRASYYCEIDILEWALKNYGQSFVDFLEKNFEPVDIVFRLAEKSSIVLLNGGGFAGPEWSVRVSLANLEDNDYVLIGKELAETMMEYVEAWKSA